MIACIAGVVVAAGLWATSPNLREFFVISIQQAEAYGMCAADNSIGEHIEFLRKSLAFVRDAPLVGHGTGSMADLFRRSAIGQTGAAGVATVNPHSQIFGVAIQLGLAGAAVLLAMWVAHYFLFRAPSWIAWVGTVVVVENVVSSLRTRICSISCTVGCTCSVSVLLVVWCCGDLRRTRRRHRRRLPSTSVADCSNEPHRAAMPGAILPGPIAVG